LEELGTIPTIVLHKH